MTQYKECENLIQSLLSKQSLNAYDQTQQEQLQGYLANFKEYELKNLITFINKFVASGEFENQLATKLLNEIKPYLEIKKLGSNRKAPPPFIEIPVSNNASFEHPQSTKRTDRDQKLEGAVYLAEILDQKISETLLSTIFLLQRHTLQTKYTHSQKIAKALTVLDDVFDRTRTTSAYFQRWKSNVSFNAASLRLFMAKLPTKPVKITEIPAPMDEVFQATDRLAAKSYKCHIFVTKLRRLIQLRMLQALLQLRIQSENIRTREKLRVVILKYLSKTAEKSAMQRLSNSFRHWKHACLTKPLDKNAITSERLKGRLLKMFLMNIQPTISLSRSFLRWKIKADGRPIREAVAKLSLHSRISTQTALWRLKSVISKKKLEEARQRRLENMLRAGRLFSGLVSHIMKANTEYAFNLMKNRWRRQVLIHRTLAQLQKSVLKSLRVAFRRWKSKQTEQKDAIAKKTVLNLVITGGNRMQSAFEKWKLETIVKKFFKLKRVELGAIRLQSFTKVMTLLFKKKAMAAFRDIYRAEKEKERKEEIKLAKNIHGMILLDLLMKKKMAMNIRSSFASLRIAATANKRNKIKALLCLIFHGNGLMKSAMDRWRLNCKLLEANEKSKGATILFSTLSDHLRTVFTGFTIKRDKSARATAIKLLALATNSRLRESFYRWRTNSKIKQATQNQTRTEQGYQLLTIFKSLITTRLKDALLRLKTHAGSKEKARIKLGFALAMGGSTTLRTAFKIWQLHSQSRKQSEAIAAAQNLFDTILSVRRQQARLIFLTAKEQTKNTKKSLKLIFTNLTNVQREAFYQWAAASSHKALASVQQQERVRQGGQKIVYGFQGLIRRRVKEGFDRIRRLVLARKLLLSVLGRLNAEIFNRKQICFERWKYLRADKQIEKQRSFFLALNAIARAHKQYAFRKLYSHHLQQRASLKKIFATMEHAARHNIRLSFNIWAHRQTERLAIDQYKAMREFFEVSSTLLASNTAVLFQPINMKQKRQAALNLLNLNAKDFLRSALYRWRIQTLEKANHEILTKKLQEQTIEKLNKMFIFHSTAGLRYYFLKWRSQIDRATLVKRFFNRLILVNSSLTYQAFRKWAQYAKRTKLSQASGGTRLDQILKSLYLRAVRDAFERFKENQFTAAELRKHTVQKIVAITQDKTKRYFTVWARNTENLKYIEGCQKLIRFMEVTTDVARLNFSGLFQPALFAKEKKAQTVRRLVSVSSGKLYQAFVQWRAQAKRLSAKQLEIQEAKRQALETIAETEKKARRNLMQEAFNRIKDEASKFSSKKRVLLALFNASHGKLHSAFYRWKRLLSLPSVKEQQATSALGLKLYRLYLTALRRGFEPMRELHFQKHEIKREAIRSLIMSMTGKQKELFNRWRRYSRFAKHLEACRVTLRFFDVVKCVGSNNFACIVAPDHRRLQKAETIRKLFFVAESNLADAFAQWRYFAHLKQVDEKINNDKIIQGVFSLSRILQELTRHRQQEAFLALIRNMKEQAGKKRALLGIFRASHGRLYEAFRKWRESTISEHKEKMKSTNALEFVLKTILKRKVQEAFDELKELWQEALGKKQQAMKRLVYMTTARQQSLLNKWIEVTRAERNAQLCRGAIDFFGVINRVFHYNLDVIVQKDYRMAKKRRVVQLLDLRTKNLLRQALQRWFTAGKTQELVLSAQNTEHARNFDELVQLTNKMQRRSLQEAFNLLKRRLTAFKSRQRVIKLLVRRKSNQMYEAFLRWKSLPSTRVIRRNYKFGQFCYHLERFRDLLLRDGFNALREQWDEGQLAKQNTMRRILISALDSRHQAFKTWKLNTMMLKLNEKHRHATNLFALLQDSYSQNAHLILARDLIKTKRFLATKKLALYFRNRLREAFIKWHNNSHAKRLLQQVLTEKSKQHFHKVFAYGERRIKDLLREGFNALQANMKEKDMMKRFILALSKTKFGRLHFAFNKWRSLPKLDYTSHKTGSRLIVSLRSLILKRLRAVFEELKEEWHRAANIKVNAIRIIIDVTKDRQRFAFERWATNARILTQADLCGKAISLFETLNQAVQCNTLPIYQATQNAMKKQTATRLLVTAMQSKLYEAFLIWHGMSEKAQLQEKVDQKVNQDRFQAILDPYTKILHRHKREAFDTLVADWKNWRAKRAALTQLFDAQIQRMHLSFAKWKLVPPKETYHQQISADHLEDKLVELRFNHLRWAFNNLRAEYSQKKEAREKALNRLAVYAEDNFRFAFILWRQSAQFQSEIARRKATYAIFKNAFNVQVTNAHPVLTKEAISTLNLRGYLLGSLFNRLLVRRISQAFQQLRLQHQEYAEKRLRVFYRMKTAQNDSLFIAFCTWRRTTLYLKQTQEKHAIVNLFDALQDVLKNHMNDICKVDKFDYGRKIALKQLYTNWATRQAALFNRWKDYVERQKLLEKAITFGKVVIACENKKRHVLQEALQRWKEKGQLDSFVQGQIQSTDFLQFSEKCNQGLNVLTHIYKKRLIVAFLKLLSGPTWKSYLNYPFLQIEAKLRRQLASGFRALSSSANVHLVDKKVRDTISLYTRLDYIVKVRLANAFLDLKQLKASRKVLLLGFRHFNNRLRDIFRRWQLACNKKREEELRQKAIASEEASVFRHQINVLSDVLAKLAREKYNEGWRALLNNKRRMQLMHLCFSRMGETAKNKMMLAFEIWHGMSNQLLIKKFYDLIVLEKSLMNYSSGLKLTAFHKIRSMAIIDYQKSYVTALWKWKLSNTEARFYTRQKVFQMRARALWQIYATLDFVLKNQMRWSFLRIFAKRQDHKDPISKMKFLALVLKVQASKRLWQFRCQKNERAIEQVSNEVQTAQTAAKAAKIAILFENRTLIRAMRIWQDVVREEKRIDERAAIVAKGREQKSKMNLISEMKSLLIEAEKQNRKRIRLGQIAHLLMHIDFRNVGWAFGQLKQHQHTRNRQRVVLQVLQRHSLKSGVRDAFNHWHNLCLFGHHFDKARFVNMLKNLEKNHRFALKQAVDFWRKGNIRRSTDYFNAVMTKYVARNKKAGFLAIVHACALSKQRDKIKAINRLIELNRIFEHAQRYNALMTWRNHAKSINPWFKRSLERLTLGSKINVQIAYWRLKYSVNVEGAHMSQLKIIKAKKIFYFAKKFYDLTLARAFWMIERASKYEDFSRTFLSDEMRNKEALFARKTSWGMNTEASFDRSMQVLNYQQLGSPMAREMQERERAQLDRVRQVTLKMILNKYDANKFDARTRKVEAFRHWKLFTASGGKNLLLSLGNAMNPQEIAMIAKHGAIDLLAERLGVLILREKKKAFDTILEEVEMDQQGVVDDDYEKAVLIEKNNELYEAYLQKQKDLDHAFAKLSSLNTKLNTMIATKLFKILDKYRLLTLLESFHKIQLSAIEASKLSIN